jgi:hypothetical protein
VYVALQAAADQFDDFFSAAGRPTMKSMAE